MNALAAMALAAGELVCEFEGGTMMLYALRSSTDGAVLQTDRAGHRPVALREDRRFLYLVQDDGASVRVTTLTGCDRTRHSACTRFNASHAWHFDHRLKAPPADAAPGRCEPWRVD